MKKQKKYRSLNPYYIRTGINRMLKLYDQATQDEKKAGKNWYKQANKYARKLSEKYGIDPETCYLVISQISPGVEWEINKTQARDLIETYHRNKIKGNKPETIERNLKKVVCSTYDGNKSKAIATLLNKEIRYKPREIKAGQYTGRYKAVKTARPGINRKTALKTYAFYENIKQGRDASEFVTIDRHHVTGFFKSPKVFTKDHAKLKSLTAARYADITKATKEAAARVNLEPYEFQAIVWEQVRKKEIPNHEKTKVII